MLPIEAGTPEMSAETENPAKANTTLLHKHESRTQMQTALCAELALVVERSLSTRSAATLALAGGSTPLPIYAALAKLPLNWEKVTAISTDERWVAADHSASNSRALKQAFIGCAIKVRPLVPAAALPGSIANTDCANALLAKFPQNFDAVLLGMGEDGHFASLFPNAPLSMFDAEQTTDSIGLTPDPLPPEAPFARVSLSMSRILRSDCLYLCITGERKLALLTEPRANKLPIDYLIAACTARHRIIHVFWSI